MANATRATHANLHTIYLFDWGDTLMVDIPGMTGKMCDWPTIMLVEGAAATLRQLSQRAQLYIATGAADSSEQDVQAAFRRGGLDRYLNGYFCSANLGEVKGSTAFLAAIMRQLDAHPEQICVVGDSFEKDILPALALGIKAVWLRPPPAEPAAVPAEVQVIHSLTALMR